MIHYKMRVKNLENEKPFPQAADSLGEAAGEGLLPRAPGLLGALGRKPRRKEHFRCSAPQDLLTTSLGSKLHLHLRLQLLGPPSLDKATSELAPPRAFC